MDNGTYIVSNSNVTFYLITPSMVFRHPSMLIALVSLPSSSVILKKSLFNRLAQPLEILGGLPPMSEMKESRITCVA